MKILKKVSINAPISTVWNIWAVEFDKAGEWMSQVVHSVEKQEGQLALGSPMVGRVCDFSTKENGASANEDIILFDKEAYRLDIRVIPQNLPVPIVQNILKSKLVKRTSTQTEIYFEANIELKTMGYFLYPLLKKGLSAGLNEILEELKYYAENGEVHPRKVKKIAKLKAKAV